jgi:hypothetical protein
MDAGEIFLHDERSNGQTPERAEPESETPPGGGEKEDALR